MSSSPRARLQLSVHDTPDSIFASFARVFEVRESDGTRWVSFDVGDVFVSIFAADEPELEEAGS